MFAKDQDKLYNENKQWQNRPKNDIPVSCITREKAIWVFSTIYQSSK